MSTNFKNVILIVAFNYSNCVGNKNFLKKIYAPYFKKVIFYSDLPTTKDEEVNYVSISRGYYLHRIFPHFAQKYARDLAQSSGFFYIMDDNILNVNLLSQLDPDKIIQRHMVPKPLDSFSGWHWDRPWGKVAIQNMLNSGKLDKHGITKFTGEFSDYFYLPIKYCTPELFELFEIFGNFNVFLEITVTTIINNIEQNKNNYNDYTEQILWDADRNNVHNKNWILEKMKTDLFIHPIKFNSQPIAKEWLLEIFCIKKCIIITTINKPTRQLLYYTTLPDWNLIVVGDAKTDDSSYQGINCIYLGLNEQKALFPEFYEKVPFNSYARKMFGYLYAFKNGYQVIYDTDDDNKYIGNLNNFSPNSRTKTSDQSGFVNLYRVFTDKHIWPRGIPPSHPSISQVPKLSDSDPGMKIVVVQGLVNNDPDVDAYYRINVSNEPFLFLKDEGFDIVCDKYSVCPFNTQNTFWTDPSTFYAMYLPITVTFRYTDILRGFIALYQLWKQDKTVKFTVPTAIQERNEHDLQKDYESEVPMYETAEKVIELLNNNKSATLREIYSILIDAHIVQPKELELLDEWLKIVKQC